MRPSRSNTDERPRIGILLDENTSGDATRYEASKNDFLAIRNAGGLPFGVPYLPEIVNVVTRDFDGLLSVGGRFAYPDARYVGSGTSEAPSSFAGFVRACCGSA